MGSGARWRPQHTGIVCGGGARHQVGDALAAERRISVLKHIPIFAHLTYNELVKVVGLTRSASGLSEAEQFVIFIDDDEDAAE